MTAVHPDNVVPAQPEAVEAPAAARGERLPLRDYFILPLIAALTLTVMAAGAEGAARMLWPDQQRDACQKADGSGFQPNCVSRGKIAEGPWVDYRYNACGLRADRPCGPKAPGALRVSVIGTSISSAAWVPFEQGFSGRLEQGLGAQCKAPVDVQTQPLIGLGGLGGAKWSRIGNNLEAALAMRPDALVTVMGPFDLEEYHAPAAGASAPAAPAAPAPAARFGPEGVKAALKQVQDNSRAAYMAQHFFYLNLPRYVPLYLKHGDAADFLRPPYSPAWRARLEFAEQTLGPIADRAKAAGVPFVIVYLPNRAQAALSAAPEPGVDAFALPAALGQIAARHGATFVDLTRRTQNLTNQDGLFYPVDGHPAAPAHALISQTLQGVLTTAAPAFQHCKT